MGTWGTGLFDNDGANDLLSSLLAAANGWALIRETLLGIAESDPEDFLEAPECEMALAAAECVAAVRGKPSEEAGDEVVQWCEEHPMKNPSKLTALALKAVRRIRKSSELKDLWERKPEEGWGASVAALEKRLAS